MTAKREAELETENRILREQVASLERIVEQATRPHVHAGSGTYTIWPPSYVQPDYQWTPTVTCCDTNVSSGTLSATS